MNINKTRNTITIEFSDDEMVILSDSLLDPLAHFEVVATQKLANCKSRILREWTTRLQETKRVDAIPTDDTELLTLILSQPDYKSRVDRDAITPGLTG